jgi:diguanylate cyclase (GGDEF)-like protein
MDMLEKLQAVEQKLSALEQLLHSTARALPEPIFVIDEFGKYLDVIGGKERSVFHSGKFITGKYLHDILPENLADMLMQSISAAIAGKTLKTLEYQLGPEDLPGSSLEDSPGRRWFEGRIYPVKDPAGEIHAAIWLAVDITERKSLEARVKEFSEKDVLTGAYNRKYFMQIFDQEFFIAKRYKTNLTVLLIDVDNLKKINEAYGNDGGDAILKEFVIFCETNLRKSDLFARYSGKEFVIMLPETPRLGAAIIAERIRANIEEMPATYAQQTIRYTISIGLSLALDSDSNSGAVLSRAETALYTAKKKGGNLVEIR